MENVENKNNGHLQREELCGNRKTRAFRVFAFTIFISICMPGYTLNGIRQSKLSFFILRMLRFFFVFFFVLFSLPLFSARTKLQEWEGERERWTRVVFFTLVYKSSRGRAHSASSKVVCILDHATLSLYCTPDSRFYPPASSTHTSPNTFTLLKSFNTLVRTI